MAGSGIDIIVTDDPWGNTRLAVAVRTTKDIEAATEQMRSYLQTRRVRVGLVFGRDTIRLLRKTYKSEPAPVVEVIGDYPLAMAHGLVASDDFAEYADRVTDWLELLPLRWDRILDEPLLSELMLDVIPALHGGVVGATGPRERRAAL